MNKLLKALGVLAIIFPFLFVACGDDDNCNNSVIGNWRASGGNTGEESVDLVVNSNNTGRFEFFWGGTLMEEVHFSWVEDSNGNITATVLGGSQSVPVDFDGCNTLRVNVNDYDWKFTRR